jgi:alpha-tubulin suppressor-like RCC1 family protein
MATLNASGAIVTNIFTKVRSYGFSEWASGEDVLMQGAGGNCDMTGLVTKSGNLHVWGNNGGNYGLGIGNTTTSQNTPLLISGAYGALAASQPVIAGAWGSQHGVALDSTGRVYAWGYNNFGQVGNNTTSNGTVSTLISGVYGSLTPVGVTVVAVACGGAYTVALDSTGRVHAWGYNVQGQLGNNSTTQSNVPVLISGVYGSLTSSVTVVAIACGNSHTVALDSTGKVHTWGNNNSSQLGNNSTTQSNVPVLISGVYGSLASGVVVTAISCGYQHTVALDSIGKVHAWGYNPQGQLGNGTTTNQLVPILISGGSLAGGTSVVTISCGSFYTLVIDSAGQIHGWGAGSLGELFQYGNSSPSIPTLYGSVGNGYPEMTIAGGDQFSVLVDSLGAVFTVGFNNSGQLGNNSLTSAMNNVKITGVYGSLAAVTSGSIFWNFTGQHRCFIQNYTSKNIAQIEGLVVCANQNKYITTDATNGDFAFLSGSSAITTNDALPVLSLSTKPKDKTVFGVVSLKTEYAPSSGGTAVDPTGTQLAFAISDGDQRAEINALGEGAMWVCDAGGPIESGDYLTSSSVPGYGMQQNDPYMCNYTIGKSTMDCDFTAPLIPKTQRRIDQFGANVLNDKGMPIYDPVLDLDGQHELEPSYKMRFLTADGTQISQGDYNIAITTGTPQVFSAAFIGVTYHCG